MGIFDLTRQVKKGNSQLLTSVYGGIGNVYFVVKSTESYYNDVKKKYDNTYSDNSQAVHATVASALAAVTAGRNDVIVLDGNGEHTLTEMLTLSDSRVNLVGIDYLLGNKRKFGQASRVTLGVTTAATDLAAIKNTGVRNSIKGVKISSNNTKAESLYGFIDGGEYLDLDCVEVYKSTDLDVTGSAEFVCNGDSAQYKNITIGSLANARSGAVIRACMLMTKGLAGAGKVARDVVIEDSDFWINASNTANRFIYGANADDVERMMKLTNCDFINNGASSFVPAQNVAFGSALTVGSVLLKNCSSVNASTAMSTTTGVFIDGPVPAADTTGIALQAS